MDSVALPADRLGIYRLFSLYNSPYAAHDRGRAIDLYPDGDAPSPVAGTVLDVRSVSAPPKPYAEAEDHLILVDVDDPAFPDDLTARILHVDPDVEPGDEVAVGDQLGRTIRSGFFAPWVDDHLHVGFRGPDANPYRASGSIRVAADVAADPLDWDGRGTVVEVGDTYAILDRPAHPAPGERFAGIAVDGPRQAVLDGGIFHYEYGGILGSEPSEDGDCVEFLGATVGRIESVESVAGDGAADDRTVTWSEGTVLANGETITGLSLYVGRERAGAKLVCPDAEFEVGEAVAVEIV